VGRDTSGMAGCWRAWCATREGQKALPLAAGTPRATGTRSPSGSLTLTRLDYIIIKCFDLSLSWFLEVPRADLSVSPHLLPSTPPAFVSYTVYKVYLGLVLLSVHASTSLEEDHGYVSVDLPKSRKGEWLSVILSPWSLNPLLFLTHSPL